MLILDGKAKMIKSLYDVPFKALLIVEGCPLDVKAFKDTAVQPGCALCLSATVAPPADLLEVDELALADFQLLFGEKHEAEKIFGELGLEWPFSTLKEDAFTTALSRWLRDNPQVARNARSVQKNLQRYGALDTADWKRQNWGSVAELEYAALESAELGRMQYRLGSKVSRIRLFELLSRRQPRLRFSAVWEHRGVSHGVVVLPPQGAEESQVLQTFKVLPGEEGFSTSYDNPPGWMSQPGF